ncbi:TraR/DksA C4-type zinc finger protein [Leucobacter sp. BZR 635]
MAGAGADRDRLHALLLAEREAVVSRAADLDATLAELVRSRESSNDDDEHDPEGVTLSSEWSRLSGLADAARAELAEIDAALERWEAGSYGVCGRCGEPIPVERLEVRPFATRCVPCASLRR